MMRHKLISILAVLPLIGALCFAAYKFGPSSSATLAQPPEVVRPESKPTTPDVSLPGRSQLFQLFGIYETAVAKGRVKTSPADYLSSIEAIYSQRGYEKLDSKKLAKLGLRSQIRRSAKSAPLKFFQRYETDGISSISATGTDADYTTDQQNPKPFSFSTLVTAAEDGGSEWATYRMEVDRSKVSDLAKLDDGDFPGIDPPLIPRLPGLRRIYALNSQRGSLVVYESNASESCLLTRYLEEMPRRGWQIDSEITANANRAAQGVMCFTRGRSLSLIWITKNKDAGTTSITISSY